MALPKANRLKRRQDFSAVYQRGIRRKSASLTLRALRRSQGSSAPNQTKQPAAPTLIGISISLKVSKRAVIRNRIKRQIRAALRHLLPTLSPGWHLVVIVHPQAIQCDYCQFLQELKQLLLNAEVCNGDSGGGLL